MENFETDAAINGYIDAFLQEDLMADGGLVFEELHPLPPVYDEPMAPQQSAGFAFDGTPIMVVPNDQYQNTNYFTGYEEQLVPQYQYYDNGSYPASPYTACQPSPTTSISQSSYSAIPSPSFDNFQSSTSSTARSSPFECNSPPPSPRRGRGRPRKTKVERGSEKVRKFRLEKQTLDEEVQKHGDIAIYHGICQKLVVSEDYQFAVKKIADHHENWTPGFVKQLRYSESVAPTRGRTRSEVADEDKLQRSREYTRRYNAQRKPGVFFLLLKDVMSQFKEKSPKVYQFILEEIRNNSPILYKSITGENAKSRRHSV
uniref:Uncharacterized protein n=1 Tax=Panagrellus redivivus TaxID=6233 RepID=A0A7E4W0B2_PANRE